MNKYSHTPVLLEEAVKSLEIEAGEHYIDATLGGGGHTKEIIKKGGIVLGIDRDEASISFVKSDQKNSIEQKRLVLEKGNFSEIKEIAENSGFKKVSGILYDFGTSSYQLDESSRGFSIRKDEILDMRMDPRSNLTAFEVVNKYSRENLVDIFYKYGEEHNAQKIADVIVESRKRKEIKTTRELAEIAERISHKDEAIHPATRIFQAIRIEVNDEIESIKQSLDNAVDLLEVKGRIIAISFHSLEDRVIKQKFREFQKSNIGVAINKKPIVPGSKELGKNRRARSAKMRIFERI